MIDKELIESLLQIINASSKRGCWEGPELSSVGHIHDKLVSELKEITDNDESISD